MTLLRRWWFHRAPLLDLLQLVHGRASVAKITTCRAWWPSACSASACELSLQVGWVASRFYFLRAVCVDNLRLLSDRDAFLTFFFWLSTRRSRSRRWSRSGTQVRSRSRPGGSDLLVLQIARFASWWEFLDWSAWRGRRAEESCSHPCRLQTSCDQTVGGYADSTSFICKKGVYYERLLIPAPGF